MLVQSIQCDKCKKVISKDSLDYFTISGELRYGKEYYTANNEAAHLCVMCFSKHFNLNLTFSREFTEKQGDILKRKIDYPFMPKYEFPFEITCTGQSKNDPNPFNGRFN